MDEERTRLDLKIARDRLLENAEPLWEELWAAVQATVLKLNEAYNHHVECHLNEHNSIIRVSHKEALSDEISSVEKILEVRIDRDERKIVCRISSKYSRRATTDPGKPRAYEIGANADATRLELVARASRLSVVELAEHEIAEQLLGMKL